MLPIEYSSRNSLIDKPSSAGPQHCWYQASQHPLSHHRAREQVESPKAAIRLRKLQLSPVAQKLANGLQNAMPSWSRLPSEQSRFLDYRDLL